MESWIRGPRAFALAGVLATVIAAVLVGVSVMSGSDESSAPAPTTVLDSTETTQLLQGIPQQGNALGRAGAPVTLVNYSDLQCPFCAEWSRRAFPDLVREYVRTGKVRVEFRGLAFLGPESDTGLRAALAAGEQGKLWHVVDLLFRNQGPENSGWLTDDTLRQVGASVDGLDVQQMLERRPAMTPKMQEAQAAATASGINGTPSFEVGPTGGRLQRVQITSLDAEGLRPAIESLLAR
ncbi:MAG TPA: DsbA family protein [Gaiellaceae bacterium]|nr:DsbA family protein [Gaiellaceae bacterium]